MKTKSIVTLSTILLMSLLFLGTQGKPAKAQSTVAFWVQTVDSCRQAVPNAQYVLTGNGLNVPKGPAPGTKVVTVLRGVPCPIQRGNCVTVPTGCLSWDIPIPSSGTATYTITETSGAFTKYMNYVMCTGGSVCPIPTSIALTIDTTGAIQAMVTNVYPDGTSVIYPLTGASYTGTQSDPAVTHNSGVTSPGIIGNCDNDADSDDHITGSEGYHPMCDTDGDWSTDHTARNHAALPLRVHCGVVIAGSPNQPCLTMTGHRKLLEWHGGALKPSPRIETPLKWTLYALCLGKGSMNLYVYDVQMLLEHEVVPCGMWHQEVFYPLEDTVFFGVDRPVEVQVWS